MTTTCDCPIHVHTLDYDLITDNIYLGETIAHDCRLNDELRRHKITADISVEKHTVDTPFGVSFFAWIPVADHWSLTPSQYEFGVSTLARLVAMQQPTYVHCEHGHGRSPSLVAAYLISRGMTPDEATALLVARRASVSFNMRQTHSLQAYADQLLRR